VLIEQIGHRIDGHLRAEQHHERFHHQARLLQLAGFSFKKIKYWSGFAGGSGPKTLNCSANAERKNASLKIFMGELRDRKFAELVI
jgi:hypothetical protein